MSKLNRMARIKGGLLWVGLGEVTHIQAAAKYAESAFKVLGMEVVEVEVRCSTDARDAKPHCFTMKRRVEWDCLNPRQGADDPKPAKTEESPKLRTNPYQPVGGRDHSDAFIKAYKHMADVHGLKKLSEESAAGSCVSAGSYSKVAKSLAFPFQNPANPDAYIKDMNQRFEDHQKKATLNPESLPKTISSEEDIRVRNEKIQRVRGFQRLIVSWTMTRDFSGVDYRTAFDEWCGLLDRLSVFLCTRKDRSWIEYVIEQAGRYCRSIDIQSRTTKSLKEWLIDQQKIDRVALFEGDDPALSAQGINVEMVGKSEDISKAIVHKIIKLRDESKEVIRRLISQMIDEKRRLVTTCGEAKIQVPLPQKEPLKSKQDYEPLFEFKLGNVAFELDSVDFTNVPMYMAFRTPKVTG